MDMNHYEQAMKELNQLFGRDYQFAMATTGEDGPSIRFVDTYYTDGAFYIVTNRQSHKAKDTAADPRASLCGRKLHTFTGRVENIGHPLQAENEAIRARLIEVFAPWYFRHNNEENPDMCYLRFTPETGFFQDGGKGWHVDFSTHTAEEFPFTFDISFTEE